MACILIPNITKGKEFSTLGAGTWDYVGQRRFTVSFSDPIYSGGGDFMVKLGIWILVLILTTYMNMITIIQMILWENIHS